MKKQLLLMTLSGLVISKANAQVEDVSIIVTPTLSYNWFDNKSTVENGLMYGFQAGFGFGKFIELRGIYERSMNMKQNFGDYERDIQELFPDFNFSDRNINVTRVGGEFKTNLPVGGLSPYLVLGTGVQTFERENKVFDDEKVQNLYASGGIGFKVNMGDRVTLNLEGRGIMYNMNPGSLMYNPGGSSDFDSWINNQDRSVMYNWNVTAGLQFYLGGRSDSDLSDMDRSYLNRFSSGMSGLKFTLAPAGAYVNFNSNSPYRSTYMLGGDLGLELTDYVGLRGYYYHATEGENPSFDFDKMAMYGVDFVGKLNVPRGIVPYITVGGGYLNVQDEYRGRRVEGIPGMYRNASSGYYAKGGVGVEVPLGKYLGVYGAANLMYSIDDNNTSVTDLRNTDELRQHTMYNVGVRLKLGKSADTDKYTATDGRYAGGLSEYDRRRLQELERELIEAYNNNDTERIAQIMEEKNAIEAKRSGSSSADLIRMTPAELESMIDKVIQGVENESTPNIENRLERLEQLLLDMNKNTSSLQSGSYNSETYSNTAVNDRLIAEINRLNQQLEDQRTNIETLKYQNNVNAGTNVITSPNTTTVVAPNSEVRGVVLNQGLGAFIGTNFGGIETFNVGIRGYYGFSNSPFMFMPEAYVALGDKNGFGVSANGILPIRLTAVPGLEPYVGLGLGIHSLDKFRPT